jgi:hypothetical protein
MVFKPLTDHGGSPSQGRLGSLEEVISRRHPLVRHLETSVHINPSRDHHSGMGFDGLHPSRHNQVFSYLPKQTGLVKKALSEMWNQTRSDTDCHYALHCAPGTFGTIVITHHRRFKLPPLLTLK